MRRASPPLGFPWAPPSAGRVGRKRSWIAPRMSSVAVRIPDPMLQQLALRFVRIGPQIFVHEGARRALERRFQVAYRGPVQLAVTDNRRRMVSHCRKRGVLQVRVHMMFLGASDRIADALVRWVVDGDEASSVAVGRYIDENTHRIRASEPPSGPIRERGRHHDLKAILDEVNAKYFDGAIGDVHITWGRRAQPKNKRRTTIKLGSYSAVQRLIRVHPVLDNAWVPRYFVSYIVYHELLHHLIPAVRSSGRMLLHTSEFGDREREFRHYARAIAWEEKHIERLLRARPAGLDFQG
jgi:hypothetical protein